MDRRVLEAWKLHSYKKQPQISGAQHSSLIMSRGVGGGVCLGLMGTRGRGSLAPPTRGPAHHTTALILWLLPGPGSTSLVLSLGEQGLQEGGVCGTPTIPWLQRRPASTPYRCGRCALGERDWFGEHPAGLRPPERLKGKCSVREGPAQQAPRRTGPVGRALSPLGLGRTAREETECRPAAWHPPARPCPERGLFTHPALSCVHCCLWSPPSPLEPVGHVSAPGWSSAVSRLTCGPRRHPSSLSGMSLPRVGAQPSPGSPVISVVTL